MTGTFSVALCTYNGSRYLSAQLESISNQTRRPDELVICDDLSSDDTVQIIGRFSASAPFKVLLDINKHNLGTTKNFEKAIGLCKGELIALADQDDVWMPHKLESLESEFRRRPNVGLVFSDADLVDESLCPLGGRLWTSIGFDKEVQNQLKSSRRLDILVQERIVTGATMAFRSQFRRLALPIPDDLPLIHDGWIAAVMASVAEVSFVEEALIKYRQHQQQQIGAPKSQAPEERTRVEELRQAVSRTNPYGRLILIGETVRSRLVERSAEFDCANAIPILDELIHHFRAREKLPRSKIKRLPHVLRELFSKRYHHYSKGLHSAVKDLLT